MSREDDKEKEKIDEFKKHEKEIINLISQQNFEEVYRRLKKLNKDYKDYTRLYLLWGDYCKGKQDHNKAEKWYIKALETDKTEKDAYMSLAKLYDEKGEHDKVDDVLWQGVHESGDALYFYSYLELFHTNMGNEQKAIDIVKEIHKKYKDTGELYYKKAEAAYVLELYPDTIDLLRRSLDKEYTGTHHYSYLANSFGVVNHNSEAVDFWKKAIALNPDEYQYYESFHGFLRNKIGSGDQVLLTAFSYARAKMSGSLGDKINAAYLNGDESQYWKYLEEYLEIDLDDKSIDYRNFCEVYKNIMLYKDDFQNRNFSPKRSLQECINRLKDLGENAMATVYEGWFACCDSEYGKAHSLFKLIIDSPDELPQDLYTRAHNGIEYTLECINKPEAAESETDKIDLCSYGINLTQLARYNKFPLKKGLDSALSKITNNLINNTSKSIMLSGPSGVGKTEAIRQLAHLLVGSNCPDDLKRYRIVQVSTSILVAGAKFIGMWEQRIKDLCAACTWQNKIIIYFEDITNIFGAGKTEGSSSNFADFLIPRIEQNQIVIIGEIDSHQIQTLFWENPNFERVVTEIKLEPPGKADLIDILQDESANRSVSFSPEALQEAIELTSIFMPYKAFPGKAVHLINNTVELFGTDSPKKEMKFTEADVILAFCNQTGIPDFIVDKSQRLDFDEVDKYFKERVLGQDHAVTSIIDAVTTFKARLSDELKPIKSFLFVGPTGVGKTEMAKVLAEFLFGSQDKIIRLNMSEYSDYNAVAKLIGTVAGWRSRSSAFLNQVRKTPFSVVLLDEIEKAHPDVFNILLQLLDEGMLEDAEGKPANFQSTIIIMTSNIGSRHYTTQTIGFGQQSNINALEQSVLTDVKNFFSPEIYNRFDEVVCYRPLSKDILSKIINREIGKVLERRGVIGLGVEIEVDPLVKDYITETGYDPKYGARHIKRAVEKSVALPLAKLIASTAFKEGDQIRVNLHKGTPAADLIPYSPEPAKDISEIVKSYTDEITISDKEIGRILDSIESRIESLKAKFNYDNILKEKVELQDRMTQPTFWDEPAKSKIVLKRFSELNRKTERMHKWERVYNDIQASASLTGQTIGKTETSRLRSQVIGLMKDLESAEMEILLEGKYDFADAFIVISAAGKGREDVKWLLEQMGVYLNWAKRRGYHYKIIGEQPKDKSGGCSIILFIGGMNAFGLLKNERGIHRKTVYKKTGSKHQKQSYDCTVLVLADVQPIDDSSIRHFDVNIINVKPPKKGWRMKSLSKSVILKYKQLNYEMSFFSDGTVIKDKNLSGDMFMSLLHYQRKKAAALDDDKNIWGSLVRTYEIGDSPKLTDHRTRLVIKSVKDYLSGKIDSLLLERLV